MVTFSLEIGILVFAFYSCYFEISWVAETFMICGLGRKLQAGHRISLTTLYLVYILLGNTKYRYFVLLMT